MLFVNFRIIILHFIAILFFTACIGNNENSENTKDETTITTSEKTSFKTITTVESLAKVSKSLDSLSITNTEELAMAISIQDPLEFFLKLKKEDNSLQIEDLYTLMKELEEKIVLKPLLEKGLISQNSFDSLKTIDESIETLKFNDLRVWESTNSKNTLSQTASDEYIKQQWILFNNKLVAFDQKQLTLEEFKSLKDAIKDAQVIFANIDTPMQNVDTTSAKSKSTRSFSKVVVEDQVTVVLNQIDENIGALKETPSNFLKYKPHQYMQCSGIENIFPFHVMGSEKDPLIEGSNLYKLLDISAPLIGNEEGKRFFQLNETGLAELLLLNKSANPITIELKHNDKILVSTTIEPSKKQKIFIPIFEEDICVPYYLTKDDENIEANIMQIQKPSLFEKVFLPENGGYDLINTLATNPDNNNFSKAFIMEFSLFNYSQDINKIISILNENSTLSSIQFLIKSPSGILTSNINVGSIDIQVPMESGKWTIFAIPRNYGEQDQYEVDTTTNELTKYYVMKETTNGVVSRYYQVSTRIKESSNRKKFIISEMKNAEFSHDGETDGNSAEVRLSLHTNIAPKLDMGKDIENAFQDNPKYPAYKCWNDNQRLLSTFNENQICYEFKDSLENIANSFFPFITTINDTVRLAALIKYEKDLKKQLNDSNFRLIYDLYADVYGEWQNSIVQINDIKFPLDYNYGIQDSIIEYERIEGDEGTPSTFVLSRNDRFYHPNIPINMPIFALTKKRMATTTLPFAFEYSAYDDDEVDSSLQIFAVAKYIVNQALAVATGNYAALICNTVDTMKEIRKNEINGEDDPLGEADFFLNRFSTNDQFYGINNGNLNFSISGNAEIPNHYTSFDKKLDYATIACSAVGAVTAGYNLYNSVDGLISGDFYNTLELDNYKNSILDTMEEGSVQYNEMIAAFDELKNGTATAETLETLANSNKLAAFANGIDVFNRLSDVNSNLGGLGFQGFNAMRSEANYYYSSFDNRKTKSNITVKEVDSLPVINTKIKLNSVKIIHNLEDGDAEVKLRTRVGVISDENPTYNGSFATNAPYMIDGVLLHENGTNDYKTLPNLPFKGYLLKSRNFNGVKDGEYLNLEQDLPLYDADYPSTNNTASIYLEIGLFEGDGGGVDDDMIGVLSKTFYLEDLFNNADGFRWSHLSGRTYRLSVFEYPVYNATNLATSVEVVDATNREKQLAHNNSRINNPSALISFDIDVTLGDFVEHEVINVEDAIVDTPNTSKEPMDYSLLNLKEKSSLLSNEMHLFDIYNNNIIVHDFEDGIKIAKIDEYKRLSWGLGINGAAMEEQYKPLLQLNNQRDFDIKVINEIKFIDDTNLLLFKKQHNYYNQAARLAIIDIEDSDNYGDVRAEIIFPLNAAPEYISTTRIDENTIKVFAIIPNIEEQNGKFVVYEVTKNAITEVTQEELANVPLDVLIINNENILLKTAKIKHIKYDDSLSSEEFWINEAYLIMYEFKNNTLRPIDTRQYTFKHHNYNKSTGYQSIFSSKRMHNINTGTINRVAKVYLYNYYDYNNNDDNVLIANMKLVYNSDNNNYRFGDKHSSKVSGEYTENEQYPYFLNYKLEIHPDDTKRDKLTFPSEEVFEDSIYASVQDSVFLDSRYIVSLVHKSFEDTTKNGDALSIIDTFHVDNTPSSILGTDLDKEHILEYSNNFHASIDFVVVDNESSISDLDITFTVMDSKTDEEYYTGTNTDEENFLQRSKLTCDDDRNCNMTIDIALKDSSSKTKYRINVNDDGIITNRFFTTWLALSEPIIYSYPPLDINLKNENEYEEVNFEIVSQNELGNGFIHEFIIENKPSWLTSSEYTFGSKILKLKGTPPIGSAGTYNIKVTAKNDRYEDVENYIINVIEPDTIPNDFTLQTFEDVQKSTLVTKDIVIEGLTGYAAVSIENGEYSIEDSGVWITTPSQITNTSLIKVRHTSSSEYSSEIVTTLNVGGKTSQLISRTITDPNTGDFIPNQFIFTDVLNTAISAVSQASITIAGINESVSLSIINGEYSLDGISWSTADTTINNEQKIFVRHTSSNLYNTNIDTILTVGGISDTFTSTTLEIPAPILLGELIPQYEVGKQFNLTLVNTGGSAISWSIENKPDWMTFNTTTGTLTGLTQAGNYSNIAITATNNSGSDNFVFALNVSKLSAPNINSGNHTLDEDIMDFTFVDNSKWRDSITSVVFQEDYGQPEIPLVLGEDYTLEAAKLSLIINGTNQIPTSAGNWQVTIKASNYYDSTLYIYVQSGSIGTIEDQMNINVLNASMRQGNVSTIEFQPLDRFGNIMKYKEVYFDVIITNINLNFIEPYIIKGINETNYQNFINPNLTPSNRHSYYTDENGWVKVQVKVPGCVDVGDGFAIVLKDSNSTQTIVRTTDAIKASLKLDNTRLACTDVDWTKRFLAGSISNMKLLTDNDGNIYVAGDTDADIEGTTNLGRDIYLSKIDRNGVTRWEKLLGTSESDLFTNFILDGENLYLAVTSSGSLDNNTNFGGNDAGLLKVSALDGILIYAKQVGNSNNDSAIGVSKTTNKINLYANINNSSYIYTFDENGTLSNPEINLNSELREIIADKEGNHISLVNKNISKYDTNGEFLLSRGNVGGANYYTGRGLFTLDTNNHDIYTTGQVKLKLFDEEVSDTTYHGSIVKRNKNGNYQWSKILGEGNLQTTGGSTTINGVTYVVYTQKNNSASTSPRNMHMKILNDINGDIIDSYTWEAGTVAYNTITSSDIISDTDKHSLYIGANVYGNMVNTNTSDGQNVIIKKQQYNDDQSVTGYSRNNFLSLITDYDNQVQWVDSSNFMNQRTFDNASNYCLDNFLDDNNNSNSSWRVPSLDELNKTINSSSTPAIKSIFEVVNPDIAYWTNEESNLDNAIGLFYRGAGGSDIFPKSDSLLIRCVRDNQ